jgi:hypothetical protein
MRTVAYENARVVLERAAERLGDGAGGGEAEEAEPQGSGKERAR